MQIVFNEEKKLFHIRNGQISYIMQLFHDGYLGHLYFGKALPHFNPDRAYYQVEREGAPQPADHLEGRLFSLDTFPQEYPVYGTGDYRIPALEVTLPNGTSALDLRYKSHRVFKGKNGLKNLPSSYAEKEDDALTLEITLKEVAGAFEVVLSYTVFRDLPVITRHSRITNLGDKNISIKRAMSSSLDFFDGDFERLHLYGAHAYERNVERRPLNHGTDTVSSARGASSHQHNPFTALLRPDTTEHEGDVWAQALVWSGNFEASTELSSFGNTRFVIGINPFDFSWLLEPQETFTTPEAVLVYSDRGLNGMSQAFHRFIREHILRGYWQRRERPVLINSWEASYFNFDEDSIVNFTKDAVKLGAELVVLDDGWFGRRDNDLSSLGDWNIVSKKKLPNGLKGLADRVHECGAKFGLWVEPEMISPDSELFRAHPDWALGVPDHGRSQGRNQYVLDLSRKDVCDYIVKVICDVLASAPIDYVKWDHNRNLSEVGSALLPPERQHETATRYVFGVYDIMKRITGAFPEVLFESCAGGGRRFDLGILCYMPQTWTSDNTDEVCRQYIQYGTSMVYPPLCMGSHVSACPNHQVGRTTPLLSRFACAMSGNFGYEMALGRLPENEQEEVRGHIALYKQIRKTIQFGTFYRLMSPFEGTRNETAWNFVSEDGNEAVLVYFRNLSKPAAHLRRVYMKGLEDNALYQVTTHLMPHPEASENLNYLVSYPLKGQIFGGRELMKSGLTMDKVDADFNAYVVVLKKIS